MTTLGSLSEMDINKTVGNLKEVHGLPKLQNINPITQVAEDVDPADLRVDPKQALPKLHGALLKNEQDVHLFERLAFMARREGR